MTDQLLTDAEITAIAARAEAWREYKGRYGQFQREVNHDLLAADIPALLAHIRAQDAEIARLRDALAALVGPGAVGYRDWFPDDMGRDGCTYCDYEWETGQPERHAPDCPIAACRALLDGGA